MHSYILVKVCNKTRREREGVVSMLQAFLKKGGYQQANIKNNMTKSRGNRSEAVELIVSQ